MNNKNGKYTGNIEELKQAFETIPTNELNNFKAALAEQIDNSKLEAFNHKEAFYLMLYKCDVCGAKEILWNSRDGVTPFMISCTEETCSGSAIHSEWNKDLQIRDLNPTGIRWFVDLTKGKYAEILEERFSKEDEPFECIGGSFSKEEIITSMLEELQEGSPDILSLDEVTSLVKGLLK